MALSPDDPFIKPSDGAANLDELCAQAMCRQLAGELHRAAQMYRAILESEPRHAAANHCLGMLLVQSKRPAEGLPNLIAALSADPQVPDFWLGYLEALLLAGQKEEAEQTLALGRRHGLQGAAVENFAARLRVKLLPPSTTTPRSSLALPPAAKPPEVKPPPKTGEVARAERRRGSRAAERLESRALAQVKERNFAAALSSARALTVRFPDRGLGWKILGTLLAADGKIDEALPAMQRAARLLPADAEALSNLGATLSKRKRFKEAETYLRKVIEIDPKFNDAYVNLGFVYASLEKFPEAEEMYRRGVEACGPGNNPQNDMSHHSSLLFFLSHNPALNAAELFAEHVAVGRWLERPLTPAPPEFSNERQPDRRLKIGFVSADFRNHALANFFEPILEELRDYDGLELHAYYNYEMEDDITRRMRSGFTQWHSVSTLSDLELVTLIKANRIDILIDLSSHTSFNRLGAFALKAAPIQASWMGYPGTTGLRAMDYYLTDRHFLPPGQFDDSFTEKIAYLPASSSFRPYADSPPVNRLPALEAGFVTFASFNRLGKLNPFTIRLWCRLLRELPNSIMIIAAMPPLDERRQALAELFTAEGVAIERLAFFPRSDMPTYLSLHNQVDLCLDTFPYTGGTTTNHALWMGVPTLTLAGQTPPSRQGAATLSALGLEGFIAANPDDFVSKGLRWSTDLTALDEVRSGLRTRWLASPGHDPKIIACGLDAVLRHMWRRWCANLPAESFHGKAVCSGL